MLIKLAWRNLWRNKLRTSIMLGAMIFGLMGVVAMMGFMSGMVDNMIHNAIAWQTSHIQIHNRKYIENPDINSTIKGSELLVSMLEKRTEIKALSTRLLADGMIGSARSTRGVRINGVDIKAEEKITPMAQNIIDGEWLSEQGRNPVLVSGKTSERLRLKLGSKVVLTFTNGVGEVTGAAFRVRGIFKTPSTSYDDNNVIVRKADLKKVARIDGVHEIAILLDETFQQESREPVVRLAYDIQSISAVGNVVRDWTQIQPLLATMMATMGISNAIMLGIFVLAMGFGIVNILLMSVFERTQEFGVLMAVGMQKHKVFALIMLESTWLGVCGATLGVLACMSMIQLLQITGLPLGAMAEGLGAYGVDTVLYPRVSLFEYQAIFSTVVISSIIAALYPARQILKQRPAQAMSEKH